MLPVMLIRKREVTLGQPSSGFAFKANKTTIIPSDISVDIAAPLIPSIGINSALPAILIIAAIH